MKYRKPITIVVVLTAFMLVAATFILPLIQFAPIYSFGPASGGKYFIRVNAFVREDYADFVERPDAIRVLWEADVYIDLLDGNGWVGPIDHLEQTTPLSLSDEPCHPQMPAGYACVSTHLIWKDSMDLFDYDVNLAAEVNISLIQRGGNAIIVLDSIPTEWFDLWMIVWPGE